MQQHKRAPCAIESKCVQRECLHKETVLLRYELNYPQLQGRTPGIGYINAQTRAWLKQWENRALRHYVPLMRAQWRDLGASGFSSGQISSSYDVLYNRAGVLSFFIDVHVNLRHEGQFSRRMGATYMLRSGARLPLSALFRPGTAWHKPMMQALHRQIEREQNGAEGSYDRDWRKHCQRGLDPYNFYITEQGIVLFFAQYSIAGTLSGIPSFLVSYEQLGGHLIRRF